MHTPQGIKKSISVLHDRIRVGSHSVTQKNVSPPVLVALKLGKEIGKERVTRNDNYSPSSDPHTRGIISKIAEQDASSKHSCRASRHLRIATAVLTLGPKNRKI
jgi:hypothetical protein